MKALYFRYCFGKIIEASMYSLAYNRLSNFAYRTAGYLACANCYAGYAKTRHLVFLRPFPAAGHIGTALN